MTRLSFWTHQNATLTLMIASPTTLQVAQISVATRALERAEARVANLRSEADASAL